jgi:phage baseplate assembly protein W
MALTYSKIGIQTPLAMGAQQDPYVPTTTLKQEAYQCIKTVVLTSKGEKTLDDNFGVGLKHWLFEFDTDSWRISLETEIRNQIALYIDFVEVLSVTVSEASQSGSTVVSIAYMVTTAGYESETQVIDFEMGERIEIYQNADQLTGANVHWTQLGGGSGPWAHQRPEF